MYVMHLVLDAEETSCSIVVHQLKIDGGSGAVGSNSLKSVEV